MTSIFTPEKTKKRRVAIYIRVSTAEQKIDGYGLEAQESKLKEYIRNNSGFEQEISEENIYKDTHTGSELSRKELNRLLEDVKDGQYDAVLVWKIDRLSRSLQHLLALFELFKKHQVSFISIQENIDFHGPIGSLIFQIFGAIAQFERELIKGRTRMGKIASAVLGNYTGNVVPYGYKKVKNDSGRGSKLEILEQERRHVVEIFNWYIFEGLGDREIAKRLNEKKMLRRHHYESKRLVEWTEEHIANIITNTIYRGEFVANNKDDEGNDLSQDKWTVVKIPACVSELTFLQAQSLRSGRIGGTTDTQYLLSGKLLDVTLDPPKAFTGAKRTKGGFSYRRKQFDRAGVHYPVFEVPGKQMEEFVWFKIREAMKDPEAFIKTYLGEKMWGKKRVEKIAEELDEIRVQILNKEIAKERVQTAYEQGVYSLETMTSKQEKLVNDIAKLEQREDELKDQLQIISSVEVEAHQIRDAAKQIHYKFDKLDPRQKKIICNLFIQRVEMTRTPLSSSGKKTRWNIDGLVIFRFNPKVIQESDRVVSTTNSRADDKKSPNEGFASKKEKVGGDAGI
jgi:site-specific DNA recombinase